MQTQWRGIVALCAVLACVPAPVAAAARPDLVVKRISEPPATIAAGASLTVTDRVANRTRRKAKRSRVGYWLSADRRRSAGDTRLGSRKQKALRGRKARNGRRVLTLPASLAPGAYHLIACADATRVVKERKERNNCRASNGTLALSAPGAPGPGAPGGGGGPVTSPGFPVAADPLAVTHTLETGNASTGKITAGQFGGGTITATADDGTAYELVVPAGALVSDEEVTLTPVAAVGGSPLSGGLVGAVEITPHGLELLKPATLTITPAGGAGPVEGQTAFLSHEGGEDFHLYPLDPGAALKLHLTHFSTPGVAQATDADRQVVLSHPPERHRAQYEQLMSEVVREARVKALADENAGMPADAMAEILRGYYNDIVHPIVTEATTDDAKATQAISELISWARQVDLLSLHEHPRLVTVRNAVWANVEAIMRNAITKGYTRCVDDHDLDYVVRLLGFARAAALLGLTLGDEAFDKAERCANFELDFDSRIDYDFYVPPGGQSAHDANATWHVQGLDIPIPITGLGEGTFGWKAFSYSYALSYPNCPSYLTTGTATRPDTSVHVLLGLDLNAREPGTPPPADRDIRVRLFGFDDVGETYDQEVVSHCGDTPPPDPAPVDDEKWQQWFRGLHSAELSNGFTDWQLGSGDLVATKSFNQTDPGDGITETTTLSLWHKPLK